MGFGNSCGRIQKRMIIKEERKGRLHAPNNRAPTVIRGNIDNRLPGRLEMTATKTVAKERENSGRNCKNNFTLRIRAFLKINKILIWEKMILVLKIVDN